MSTATTDTITTSIETDNPESKFLQRFGAVILSDGIATVPAALYTYQARLKLKPQHAWFISVILMRKWTTKLPYPSLHKLEEQTGVSRQTLHGYQRELVALGWLRVVHRERGDGGKATNAYDFSPLFEQLEAFIQEENEAKVADDDVDKGGYVNPSLHGYVNTGLPPLVNPSLLHKEEKKKEENIKSSLKSNSSFDGNATGLQRVDQIIEFYQNQGRQTGHEMPLKGVVRGVEETKEQGSSKRESAKEKLLVEDSGSAKIMLSKRQLRKVLAIVQDISDEFADSTHLFENMGQTLNIFQAVYPLDLDTYLEQLYRARGLTKESKQQGAIRGSPMAYFFVVLRNELQLPPKSYNHVTGNSTREHTHTGNRGSKAA